MTGRIERENMLDFLIVTFLFDSLRLQLRRCFPFFLGCPAALLRLMHHPSEQHGISEVAR